MSDSERTARPFKIEFNPPDTVYKGFFQIDRYRVKHERYDGRMSDEQTLEVFERGDSVAVLMVDPDEEVVFLVEQFRLPTHVRGGNGWILEPPAGMIRKDESPADCVRREVIEETGYQVTELTLIARFFVSPGGATERVFLYYAEVRVPSKAGAGGGLAKDGEDIRVETMKLDDFFAVFARGGFEDAKLIIAAQWLQAKRTRLPAEKLASASRTFDFQLEDSDKIVGYKTGSITAVTDVDVWVNPTDTDMILDPFRGRSVSAAIRASGAERFANSDRVREDTIADALRRELNSRSFVAPATVVDTVPGALERTHNVKRVFHVAVVPGAIGKDLVAQAETLELCVERVLEGIDRNNRGRMLSGSVYKSVLFPILGTGQGGFFNRDVVPRLVAKAIQYFKDNPKSKLNKIYFCAYSFSDREILEQVLGERITAGQLKRLEPGIGSSS